MASLVSPGVSVTVIDESFYIPAQATTVPVFFVATKANKLQPDGVSAAEGTKEAGIVRTVTSIGQSVALYGIPDFRNDGAGNQFHGDCRNEYGLMALNQFLGVGNRAYVVRANVDSTDGVVQQLGVGTVLPPSGNPTIVPGSVGDATMGVVTIGTGGTSVVAQTITVVFDSATTFDVMGTKAGYLGTGVVDQPFSSKAVSFTITTGATTACAAGDRFQFKLTNPVPIVVGTGNGLMSDLLILDNAAAGTVIATFTTATAFTVSGTAGVSGSGTAGTTFTSNGVSFLITTGGTPFAMSSVFTITIAQTAVLQSLGLTQANKRTALVTALQASVRMNQDIRSETYEFNLILCPGFPEVADEMLELSIAVNEEAFVIADTPVDRNPEQVAAWSMTSERKNGTNVAYYYPWGLASNLDGVDVVCAPSGIAVRTYAYSDNQSYVWFAPAGARRGVVSGISTIGYVTGTLGTATTFVEAALNQGQRDNLYEFFKNVNPIVFFPGRGILIWGQKTSPAAASALDRVNVVRLVMYMKRGLRKGAFPFVFEPNDKVTRDNLKAMADGFLSDILTKRGLYDFVTLCDSSNNTPDRVDRNELYLDVAIKPVKAAEFVYIPIRVLSTGAAMPS